MADPKQTTEPTGLLARLDDAAKRKSGVDVTHLPTADIVDMLTGKKDVPVQTTTYHQTAYRPAEQSGDVRMPPDPLTPTTARRIPCAACVGKPHVSCPVCKDVKRDERPTLLDHIAQIVVGPGSPRDRAKLIMEELGHEA